VPPGGLETTCVNLGTKPVTIDTCQKNCFSKF
jgi:hypothetical protein